MTGMKILTICNVLSPEKYRAKDFSPLKIKC